MTEIWKDIPGYKGLYKVSNMGNIFGGRNNKFFKFGHSRGYSQVTLLGKTISVHRLVAQAFLGLDINDTKMLVCHKDDNRTNNHIDNLFLGTHLDNRNDMVNKGRENHAKGEKHGKSKLTSEQIIDIRNNYKGIRGEKSRIAERFGISTWYVSYLLSGKGWDNIS